MPNIRCRYYDEETGAPIGGGCRRGSDCDFVHPSQSQWASARPSWNPNRDQGFQNYRKGDYGKRDRDGGDRERTYGQGLERTSANAIPTGPRNGRSTGAGIGAGAGGSSSAWGSSAWGNAPIGGTAWGDQGEAGVSNTANASAGAWPGSSTQASSSAAMADRGVSSSATGEWGAAQSDWGAPSDSIPWGAGGSSPLPEPVAGGWGMSSGPAAKAGDGWGDSPKKSSEHKDATRSSFAEPAPRDKDKGKAREVAMESPVASSPQVSFHTPQFDFATTRTPRSPNWSPQDPRVAQDPRRKMSMAGVPSDDQGIAARAAKETRREREVMRMSSLGVPVPTANAGPEGASSKANPFAFPRYTPAENMDVSRNEPEPGQVQEEQPVQHEDIDMIDGTARGESLAPQDPLPVGLKAKWKDFIRTLSKAVSLQLELKTLEDSREKQRKMHRSKAYQSASLVGVHKTFEELHKATDDKISDARKDLNRALDKLSRYPLDGLPAPSQDDARETELEQVRAYVSQTHAWLEEIRPIVEKRLEAHHQAVQQRQQAEEEAKKAAEEAEERAKAQLNKAKWVPITSERVLMGELRELVENLDGRATDLEEGLDELRHESANPAEVVSRLLEERGYQKQGELGPRLSQTPSEEGEVRPEPPAPPKSYEELQKDMSKLKRRFKKADRDFAESAKKLGRHEQSTLARKRDYFELARDNASLNIKLQELAEDRTQVIQQCTNNEKAIADLRALMDKHGASIPPPAPPPTAEEITQKLKQVLLSELLPIVERAVSRLKGGVEESMRDSEENICKQLFSILQPAVAMVDTVKPVLDRHPAPDAPSAHASAAMLMPPPPPPVQTAQHS
ncbi:hypothetical protein GSI_13941 [Ganoderma sinense ZZ0214-1]|uniref:C3H1-type domain-containing protein n=1 Tax=Ganoderma sinense ZZ0214-1 TaxID=1077348 RepID=A0A2G8RS76_9APHY|nr:hypothetical protein GSI_13941 [Ganoderma sinense ZZ0214-1]